MKRNRNLALAALCMLALIGLSLAKSGVLTGGRGALPAAQSQRLAETAQPATSERSSVDDAQKIQRLQTIIPQSPAVAHKQEIDVMREAAETKRDAALPPLIKALAYNLDPVNQNENMTPEMLLPAVPLLKTHFGEKAVPALYREAVKKTTQKWYRNRIAVAVRAILAPEAIQKMNAQFLQGGADAQDFASALATKNLELYLARSDGQNLDKLDQAIKARQRKGRP